MPSIDQNEIRHEILEILYRFDQENPSNIGGLTRERMKEILQIPEKQLDFNIFYLKEKMLVRLFEVIHSWIHARITAFGIDVIENKEMYSKQFPFILQEIHGDVYGTVIQAVDSQVNLHRQVTNVFQHAHEITNKKTDIEEDLREEVNKYLTRLEEELKKKEPDLGKIHKLWKWLKKNATWVIPLLTQVVLESLKMTIE